MALAQSWAVALTGTEGRPVEVQCDVSAGLPGLSFTGRADPSVVESRDRIRAAVLNSALDWPARRLTVALLPADVRKTGSRFDLAICLALLAAGDQVPRPAVADAVWLAELGLDGKLRPVPGVLPSVLAARDGGIRRVVVAAANAAEASLVPDVEVRAADRLADVTDWLTGAGPALPLGRRAADENTPVRSPDLADVVGQASAKRALELAAAGAHHLYLVGTPGSGKTMLAERLPGLLPPLADDEALEVSAVHSVAGLLGRHAGLIRRAPLQAPHHSASVAALVGGGSHLARPGAISLAHHGVLFLDEAPEFPPRILDALRQPIEDGFVVLHRGGGAVRYPARFQLVLAANPCPCGQRPPDCECAVQLRRRYTQRLSGPLMDRVDLQVHVRPVPRGDLFDRAPRESSATVAERVADARRRAERRWAGTGFRRNGAVPGSMLRGPQWALPAAALRPLEHALERGTLTARGFDRVLRLAWTAADLAGRDEPDSRDVSEALFFRTGQGER